MESGFFAFIEMTIETLVGCWRSFIKNVLTSSDLEEMSAVGNKEQRL